MTLDEFIQGNKAAGQHYFDASTMRFFKSRIIHSSWNGDGLFLTSEQRDYTGGSDPRMWTIRRGDLTTFNVKTVGDFQAYSSLHRAQTALRKMRQVEVVVV